MSQAMTRLRQGQKLYLKQHDRVEYFFWKKTKLDIQVTDLLENISADEWCGFHVSIKRHSHNIRFQQGN